MKKVLFIFMAVLVSLPIFAGTTGQLAGKVRDDKGNTLTAVIILEGTQIGTQSKDNGQYIIINIPPGTYDVKCSAMGYETNLVKGVRIFTDQTTTQNFTLNKDAMEMKGIKVTDARIQNIKKDKTTSGNIVTSETIEDIDAESIEEIVAIQAGATTTDGELHVRGGRANEVNYTVDGMSVSDPVDGGAALTIDQDAIADMSVMTGGFTAEYGNAQSGIVNIVTKSGGENFSGKFETNTDHLFSDLDDTSNEDEIKMAIGGPISGKDFTFFFNAAALWSDSRYRKYYVSDPQEDIPSLESDYSSYDPYENRDSFAIWDLGDRNQNLYNANLKTKYRFNASQNFTFAMRGDYKRLRPYNHSWRYALEHFQIYESVQQQYIFTYDHLFNPQENLKFKVSYYNKSYELQPNGIDRGDFFALMDSSYWEPYYLDSSGRNTSGIFILDPEENGRIGAEGDIYNWEYLSDGNYYDISSFASPGSIYPDYQDDSSAQLNLRADYEYQVNPIHGLKSGVELIRHFIKKDRLSSPWNIDPTRYNDYLSSCDPFDFVAAGDSIDIDGDGIGDVEVYEDKYFYNQEDNYNALLAASGSTDGYRASPWQAAFYAQDRMEWEGMIVNAGFRFDFWYLGENYEIMQDDRTYKEKAFDDSDKMQLMISPRLGISHPISEKSVVHFAYNYQNQLPQMQYIFTTADSSEAATSDDNIVVGNSELEPQITVTYEVGLQHQLLENLIMDITAYYKNIYNYVNTRKVYQANDETVYWYEFISEDYGSVRGIDLNLTRPLSNFISGSASYSLAWANGNSSEAVIQDETTNLREFPLDWDIRHSGNLNLTFRIQKDEEFYIGDWLLPLDDFSVSSTFNIASGAPYTPQTEEGTTLDVNSGRRPFTSNTNLNINKRFTIFGKTNIKVYFSISNLFNKINYSGVYPKTGDPYDDGLYDETETGYVDEDGDYVSQEQYDLHKLAIYNPSRKNEGRTYRIGFSYNF